MSCVDCWLILTMGRQHREATRENVLRTAGALYGPPEDKARTAAAGFDAHLVKSVTAEALRAVLTDQRARADPPACP